jgi:hypothetical protein
MRCCAFDLYRARLVELDDETVTLTSEHSVACILAASIVTLFQSHTTLFLKTLKSLGRVHSLYMAMRQPDSRDIIQPSNAV